MWMKWAEDNNGQGYNWEQAKQYCETLTFEGYSDWRLPTIDELRTLLRGCNNTVMGGSCKVGNGCYNHNNCAQDVCMGCEELKGPGTNGFYQVDSLGGNGMWSSTTDQANQEFAWAIDFRNGHIGVWHKGGSYGPIRCVRDAGGKITIMKIMGEVMEITMEVIQAVVQVQVNRSAHLSKRCVLMAREFYPDVTARITAPAIQRYVKVMEVDG